ncbi:MAG: hypothetical protein KJ666_05300 [Bacteroidetes bacterium]|nr:hypothetical protein [Bacteroidota bacterium]
MKQAILILFFLFTLSVWLFAQTDGITPKFPLHKNDIELTRIAQSTQYFDKIGRKAALIGFENGSFEMWIWPWKVLRNFELQFFLGSSTTPILAKDIVRTISVTPEATILTYSYESFSVREIIFIPVEKTAAIILLDIYTTEPLTIVPSFFPVMQPQWPAGIGGQYSYWDDNQKAFIISESQQRGLFLCGSPLGKQMSAPPAHMFADNPLQFKIELKPNEANENYIPILIVGSPVKTKYDSVKALYGRLLSNIQNLYEKNYEYYQNLQNSTIQIKTPNEKLNLAFEWGKIGLHNLMIENSSLGKGLVAGYGLSGGGGRPGFAWFFGGDAFINSLALNSLQDFSTTRDALIFTQKWQRQDNFPIRKKTPEEINKDIGKMAHELSQSEGLIDWWNDYHFGYNHADTTPWYLYAIGDYFKQSGDIQFLKNSWKSIKSAYKWCLGKDSNNDGLMDLKNAGLGVLEFGAFVKIYNDQYTQALWTQGLKELINMAEKMGDIKIKKEAEKVLAKATKSLENLYWMEDVSYYSFGADENGNKVKDKSAYSTTGIALGLLDDKRSESTIKAINQSDMTTDWGIRNLTNKSSLYYHSNYNYGAVWPFTSIFVGWAQFNQNFNLSGYHTIQSTVQHLFENGLGLMPEVFSGNLNQKLGEAYHNQGFSYTGYIVPIIRGLLGLEVDVNKKKITFAPKLPADWDFIEVNNIRVGENVLNAEFKISSEEWEVKIETKEKARGEINVIFSPSFGLGNKVESITVDGRSINFEEINGSQAYVIKTDFKLKDKTYIKLGLKAAPTIFLLPPARRTWIDEAGGFETPAGAVNRGLKIISQELTCPPYSATRGRREGKSLYTKVEGLCDEVYQLGIKNYKMIKKVSGAELKENKLLIHIPSRNNSKFVEHEFVIEF